MSESLGNGVAILKEEFKLDDTDAGKLFPGSRWIECMERRSRESSWSVHFILTTLEDYSMGVAGGQSDVLDYI